MDQIIDQNAAPIMPAQPTKTPMGIKVMASLLLLMDLWIAFDVVSSIPIALLIRSIPLIIILVLGAILAIYTEKTAMGLFKLKASSKKNYYLIVGLDALYLAAKSQLVIFLIAQRLPPAQIYIDMVIPTLIIFAIFALPFFLITKKQTTIFS